MVVKETKTLVCVNQHDDSDEDERKKRAVEIGLYLVAACAAASSIVHKEGEKEINRTHSIRNSLRVSALGAPHPFRLFSRA